LRHGDPFYSFASHSYWIDIGTPLKYMEVNSDLLTGEIAVDVPGSAYTKNIWTEEGCNIHPEAKIEGPAVIGSNCIIEAQAHIKGPSVIGPDCHISAGSLVEKSIVWHNVSIGKGAKLQQCIVANGVSIGEGCHITAGCIIGNKVSIEMNIRLAPNTKVMPNEKLSASNNKNC